MNHSTFFISLVLLLATPLLARTAEVTASLSSLEAYVGSPIVLRVEIANAKDYDPPQVPDIDGVEIESKGQPSRSSHISIINGRRTERQSVVYAWNLTPLQEGTFHIPPISVRVDGQIKTTDPLRFSATKSESGDLLFVEILGDEEKIFVGQPMKLTLRLWIRPFVDRKLGVALSEGDMWHMISQERSNWGIFSERIAEMAANNQRPAGVEELRPTSDGTERRYFRYDIEATVYPKRPGRIDGDSVRIVVNYPVQLSKTRDPFDSFFDDRFSRFFRDDMPSMFGPRLVVSESRPIVVSADVHATEVLPIPTTGQPEDYQGAVGHYDIVADAEPTHVKAGDPITLRLGIRGDGPMELVQAPPLSRIEAITKDFKVSDEPLAGIVENNIKYFTTRIRPRREGIEQIPAIPFSYFDPTTEEFVTVHTDPIAIQVDPADQLALDAIVSGTNDGSSADQPEQANQEIRLTNYLGSSVLASTKPVPAWWIGGTFAAPPLIALSIMLARRRDRLTSLVRSRRARQLNVALRQIRLAKSSSEIGSALTNFVSQRLGVTRIAPSNIAELLRPRIDNTILERLLSVIDRCEQASYAGMQSVDLATLRTEAVDVLRRLDAELKTADGIKHQERPARQPGGRRSAIAGCLLACLFITTGASSSRAATVPLQLTDAQRQKLLQEAEQAYTEGTKLASSDAAESKQAFLKSAQKYQTLVDAGICNDRIYFNLGNAYYQTGSFARAIASYEQALFLNPWSPARINLKHARRQLEIEESNVADLVTSWTGFQQSLVQWNHIVSGKTKLLIGGIGWSLFWFVLFVRRVPFRRATMVVAIAVSCLCAASLYVDQVGNDSVHRAVVVAPAAQLRAGNGEAFDAIADNLNEGATFPVFERRGQWLKIDAIEAVGWIHEDDVVVISGCPSDVHRT